MRRAGMAGAAAMVWVALALPALAQDQNAPVPTPAPGAEGAEPSAPTPEPQNRPVEELPVPDDRPAEAAPEATPDTAPEANGEATVPPVVPVPETPPDAAAGPSQAPSEAAEPAPAPQPAYIPPDKARTKPEPDAPQTPDAAVTPEQAVEAAAALKDAEDCEAELTERGVRFSIEDTISDGDCGVLRPVRIEALSSGVTVAPPTQMLCRTALALDIWVSDGVVAAGSELLDGAKLESLSQASTYVCRARASESRISEHSRGSAIDISAFGFDGGRTVEVKAQAPSSADDKFLAKARRTACGPFRTVLGPGTDADHDTHFHLDIAARNNDSTYCR